MVGQACACVCVCVSNPQLPLESPIHPSPVCEVWRRREGPASRMENMVQSGCFLSRSPFFLCGWLFFFIYLPSKRPALSPITHPPFCTLVLACPLAASLPHSGADVTSVALPMLPTAPYNAHLYFTLWEGFSCLFLHECCKLMFCRGTIVWFN